MTFKHDENKLSYFDTAKKNGMIFPELEEYFKIMGREKSPRSLSGYQDSISRFLIYFNIRSLADMEKIKFNDKSEIIPNNEFDFIKGEKYNSLKAFQSELNNGNMIYRSVNTHVLRIKAIWSSFYNDEIIQNYCISKLKPLDKPFDDDYNENEIFALTRDEEKAIIDSCENIQKKLLLTLMFKLGLRCDEVAGILMSNISNCRLKIKGKGNKPADFALSENICNLLQEYLNIRDTDSIYLFYTTKGVKGNSDKLNREAINATVKKYAKLANVAEDRLQNVTGHTPRKTFCCNAVEDYDIYTASKMCRHSNISTTEKFYAKIRQAKLDAAFIGMK